MNLFFDDFQGGTDRQIDICLLFLGLKRLTN